MKNDLTCAVVRDLLPVYIDGLASQETNEALERHLSACRHSLHNHCVKACARCIKRWWRCGTAMICLLMILRWSIEMVSSTQAGRGRKRISIG